MVIIKWSLDCAKRIGTPASLAALAFQGYVGIGLGLEWVMDEKSQAHLSSAGIWALFRMRKFTSSIGAGNGEATGRSHRKPQEDHTQQAVVAGKRAQ